MQEVVLTPYKKGFLDVGDGHKIYYEVCGNPQGKSILYVHGGPGAGFSESSKKYFDAKLWNIILFDQRGSGKSTPFASLEHNTTDDLVGDMNKLLDFLGIEKVTLFGGSWGSTLSLVFAIRNTKRINGLVLRGIFLPSKEDNEYFFGGTKVFFPEVWDRFIKVVPKEHQKNPAAYYFDKMQHGSGKEKELYTYEWAYYETSLLNLKSSPKKVAEDMHDFSYKSLSPLEAHYLLNMCFLPDNYILQHADTLSGLPTYIIHGRYDVICQPINAYNLQKKIKGSKVFFPISGHASTGPAMKKKLQWAVKKIYPLV